MITMKSQQILNRYCVDTFGIAPRAKDLAEWHVAQWHLCTYILA